MPQIPRAGGAPRVQEAPIPDLRTPRVSVGPGAAIGQGLQGFAQGISNLARANAIVDERRAQREAESAFYDPDVSDTLASALATHKQTFGADAVGGTDRVIEVGNDLIRSRNFENPRAAEHFKALVGRHQAQQIQIARDHEAQQSLVSAQNDQIQAIRLATQTGVIGSDSNEGLDAALDSLPEAINIGPGNAELKQDALAVSAQDMIVQSIYFQLSADEPVRAREIFEDYGLARGLLSGEALLKAQEDTDAALDAFEAEVEASALMLDYETDEKSHTQIRAEIREKFEAGDPRRALAITIIDANVKGLAQAEAIDNENAAESVRGRQEEVLRNADPDNIGAAIRRAVGFGDELQDRRQRDAARDYATNFFDATQGQTATKEYHALLNLSESDNAAEIEQFLDAAVPPYFSDKQRAKIRTLKSEIRNGIPIRKSAVKHIDLAVQSLGLGSGTTQTPENAIAESNLRAVIDDALTVDRDQKGRRLTDKEAIKKIREIAQPEAGSVFENVLEVVSFGLFEPDQPFVFQTGEGVEALPDFVDRPAPATLADVAQAESLDEREFAQFVADSLRHGVPGRSSERWARAFKAFKASR